jgi:hypothetical protein
LGAAKIVEENFSAHVIVNINKKNNILNSYFVELGNVTVAKVAFAGRPAFSWLFMVPLPSFAY